MKKSVHSTKSKGNKKIQHPRWEEPLRSWMWIESSFLEILLLGPGRIYDRVCQARDTTRKGTQDTFPRNLHVLPSGPFL